MAILEDIQGLDVESPIDLYQLTWRGINVYFTNFSGVYFGGIPYAPLPVEFNWAEVSSEGPAPGSRLVVSDVNSYLGSLIDGFGDFIGAILTVKRTWKLYLDNQPAANPAEFQGPLRLIVNQRTWEPGVQLELSCIGGADFQRRILPARGYYRRCQWILRSASYDDGNCQARIDIHYDLAGNPTSPTNRACSKDLDACKRYHGHARRFGGFPGVRRY